MPCAPGAGRVVCRRATGTGDSPPRGRLSRRAARPASARAVRTVDGGRSAVLYRRGCRARRSLSRRRNTVPVGRSRPPNLTGDAARFDEWWRQIGPSSRLSAWCRSGPARSGRITRRYRLEQARPALSRLGELTRRRTITLLPADRLGAGRVTVLADLVTARVGA
ncbi:DUF488 family protein, N3 subclade [Amycolatopsis sp. NBC_01480]|uniref:DUF488 family protein, N3 subclade n=1 Tax=Amycolatopsis sp. NBC_01480 TaxID=2903562 RepID=UPI003FA43823